MQDWFNIWKSINVIHHINKLNIYPYLSPFTKLKSKSIIDLNINSITQDLIEEKEEISLKYMGTRVHFLCWTQQHGQEEQQWIKGNSWNWDASIKQMTQSLRQPSEWKKIFVNPDIRQRSDLQNKESKILDTKI